MIAEFGNFCLVLSWFISLAQSGCGLWGAARLNTSIMLSAKRSAFVQMVLCVTAFACLIISYILTDLSVLNVATHSHSMKPLLYKISGAWGNHEGSMLLWVTLLAMFGAVLGRSPDQELSARAVGVQGLLSFGFLGFLLFTSNPFERLDPAPIDGNGLNPLLQDPGLAFHPPLLYIGYVGFSVAFSYAVAALLSKDMPERWAEFVRPWVLFSWTFLSAGIALGSWWAYYELGWGGWWFWDPVENASLLPWLVGTALLHSLIVTQHRGALKRWGILLSLLAFSFSMLGTFLVRSGILTSVHAFATDPERGLFILLLVFVYCGGAFKLYAFRTQNIPEGKPFAALSREGFIVLNNLFLMVATATVFIGTLYPLILSSLELGQISVGPQYFEATFVPIALPMILLAGIAPFIAWKRGKANQFGSYAWGTIALMALGGVLIMSYYGQIPWTAWVGFLAGMWLIAASALAIFKRRSGIKSAPINFWAMIAGHVGVGIAILGMVGTSILKVENMAVLSKGDTLESGRYEITFNGTKIVQGQNYQADQGIITARMKDTQDFVADLTPEKRIYPVASSVTTEAGIYTSGIDDLYVALGSPDNENGDAWIVRAFSHPLVTLLWAGFMIIVLSGFIAFIGVYKSKDKITS